MTNQIVDTKRGTELETHGGLLRVNLGMKKVCTFIVFCNCTRQHLKPFMYTLSMAR